ncbi:lipoprotein [Steroidobacter agaridevorans]|nr:lipoprotein [Steroidobacter agaridevorans]
MGRTMARVRIIRSLIIVLAGAWLCSGCDRFIDAEARIGRAQKQIAEGNDRAAFIELQNAVRSEPDNVPARLMLAELSLRLGDPKSADRELAQALQVGASAEQVAVLGADIRLALGETQQLLTQIDTGESGLAEPALSTYRGLALLKLNQSEQAIAAFQKALQADAKSSRASIGLAEALAASGQSDKALEVLNAVLETNSKDATALLSKGTLLARRGETSAALAALTDARQNAAGQLSMAQYVALLAALVETHLAAGDLAGADAAQAEIAKLSPDSALTQLLAGRIAFARRDYTNAVAAAQKALRAAPGSAQVKFLLAVALLEQGNLNQAEAQLAGLVRMAPENVEARKLLARVNLRLRRPDVAMQLLTAAQQTGVEDPEIDALLVPALAAVDGKAAARAQIDRMVAAKPNDVDELRRAASLYAVQREFDLARNTLARALKLREGDPATLMALARVEHAAGQRKVAVEVAQQAVSASPEDAGARMLLAQLAAAGGDLPRAIEQLEYVRAKDANATEARVMLASAYLRQQNDKAADAVIGELQSAGKSKFAVANALGNLYAVRGRYQEARAWFQDAARLEPGNPQPQLNVARMQLAVGDKVLARETLEKVVAAHPDSLSAAVELISLDLRDGRPEAARERIARLKTAHPNDAAVAVIEGDVAMASKAYSTAASAYESAARLAPSGSTAVRLSRARRLGNMPEPGRPLAEWLDKNPDDLAVRLVLAEDHMTDGRTDRAIAEYERAVQADARSPMALNNLAWLYQQKGDARAREVAKRAHELAPDVAAIADTYGWILVQSGDVGGGLAVLKQAVSGATPQPDIRYHYAAALAKAGQRDAARAELVELMRTKEQYSASADARKLLAELGGE